jgi:hypothetical protein
MRKSACFIEKRMKSNVVRQPAEDEFHGGVPEHSWKLLQPAAAGLTVNGQDELSRIFALSPGKE